jgi:translocator protein
MHAKQGSGNAGDVAKVRKGEGRFRWWHAALFLLAADSVNALSFRRGSDARFYETRRQPRWAPPSAAFPPVWTAINVVRLYGDLRLLNASRELPARRAQLAARGVTWATYLAFAPLNFRLRSPVLGAAVTAIAAAGSLTSVALGWRGDRRIAGSYVPITLWTTYATAVAVAIARRNPDPFFGRDRARG